MTDDTERDSDMSNTTEPTDAAPQTGYLAMHRSIMRDLLIWRDSVLSEPDEEGLVDHE